MAERTRVLRVIARMNMGGPAVQVTTLMRGMDQSSFEQVLVTGFCDENEQDHLELRAPDVEHTRIMGLGRAVRPTDDLAAAVQLAKISRSFRPHVVHTHTAKAGLLGRLTTGYGAGSKRVHTFHGHLLNGYFSAPVQRAVVQLERALARRTDALVAVGEQVRDDLLAAGIGRPSQYSVVAPGLSLPAGPGRAAARARWGIPEEAPVIAFVARLTPIKRPDRFAEIALQVAASLPGLHVVVCGGGELSEELSAQLAPLGDRAHLLGWQSDVRATYDACDVVALTSDNEGMPVSLIEAALAGRPSVTTDVGSAREVVLDDRTGLVVSTPAEHAAALLRILTTPNLARAMGQAAHEHAVARFSEARLVADTEQLYRRLLLAD